MSPLCAFCKRARPVLRYEDYINPFTECLNCGATVGLPEMRYRVDWNTAASIADGRAWYEFFKNRAEAIAHAKRPLEAELDRAVVTDRWKIESPLIFIKQEAVAV